ncbi:putative cyclic nucleotide-gated ion channel 5 [Turnera subulata]|uniref:Cyclic nucleotide-gated ion channel 5 n=1 Tax=Turnera subulata TaxID=218843 RepID=A0A9Q0J934_9ROSI|nr:putative cyclic nucleotide-gated ion channel 5 [Turnera subulata]
MFDKSGYLGGPRDKFVRLDDLDSRLSSPSDTGVRRCGFGVEGFSRAGHGANTTSRSFKKGIRKGSEGLKSIGRSLRFGVSRAVFPEDLKVSEKKIFDPQDKLLQLCNKLFVISCILAVSVDPLFFYLPVFNDTANCLGIDRKLAITATTLRTIIDAFYLIRMALQFRTAYIKPSSRVFGRGELVIDSGQIAKRYLLRYFFVDFLSILPLPQIVVWRFLARSNGSDVLATKQALLFIVLLQYIPRFVRIVPLTSELKRTAGVFAETAWAGAAYYLLLYMLASHIVGAFWYLLAVERMDTCWQERACTDAVHCKKDFLYCGNQDMNGYGAWGNISDNILERNCSAAEDGPFDYGIYLSALTSNIVSSKKFISKYCFCLWWGLQNLSTLGQGLQTSTYPGEVIFSIALAIFGLILFALLIGNMQTYLQSLTIRLEEMRVKRRDSEQWMHHRLLPQDLRERVRRYDQYKWLETRGVDEENLVQSLPKDLRRDIKRHLCLALVRRVPLFENMDERLLDAICERLKPCLFTENTYIVREGDPVDEMLFIIRGRLESVTTDGGRSGFFNRGWLKEGDFCGEELLTWALDPKSGVNLPSSTRTVKALTEVEAFALIAEELKFVASQFRRLHSRQVQHTFRFYSQQWRTWAACFIQAAWRRYSKRKTMELRRKEEEDEAEGSEGSRGNTGGGSYSIGATFLATRFAANALRGVHRNRNAKTARELVKLQKPPEPDFSAEDAD